VKVVEAPVEAKKQTRNKGVVVKKRTTMTRRTRTTTGAWKTTKGVWKATTGAWKIKTKRTKEKIETNKNKHTFKHTYIICLCTDVRLVYYSEVFMPLFFHVSLTD
jgi:hypothetical protein